MKKKNILKGVFLLLLVAQVIQTDKGPFEIKEQNQFKTIQNPPEKVLSLLQTACYDCHSYETKYPWYAYVAPVSWAINSHTKNARKKMNFSTWGDYSLEDQKHLLHECAEEIEEGHMPPKGYSALHSEAAIDASSQKMLLDWLESNSH